MPEKVMEQKQGTSSEQKDKEPKKDEPVSKTGNSYEMPPPYKPPLPFPQREQKAKAKKQFQKFLTTLQGVHVKMPLIEAITQIPSYVKFLKELLTNKHKWEDYSTVPLTGECSAIL